MERRAMIKVWLRRGAYGVALMILGAQAPALYLIYIDAGLADRLRPICATLQPAFLLFVIAASALDRRKSGSDLKTPSPRHSGVAVVLFTGIMASVTVGRSSYLLAVLIAAGTIAVAAGVWRFATTHAGEIGEARFTTAQVAE